MTKKTISIIGSGPSAMMLAAQLCEQKFNVTIYERNFAPGRKFLVAGDGGFNLTHSEPLSQFIAQYTPASFLEKVITSFSNTDLIHWLASIGIPTFIGSSKRVFPVKPIKPIEVLNAILKLLAIKNVVFKNNFQWQGWDKNSLVFTTKNSDTVNITSDIVVFALGGSSWRKTGSDGSWLPCFSARGIDTVPFQPANCAVRINWTKQLLDQLAGACLKNISIKCVDKEKRGEVVITAYGLEGGPVYALSPQIRNQLQQMGAATLYLDLKPAFTLSEIIKRLTTHQQKKSWTKYLEDQLKLSESQLIILKNSIDKESFIHAATVAAKIKNLPLQVTAMAPIDEAISTVGGIPLHEIDANFQLKKLPNTYAIGEMLDWDAPTGGYLLQACFSMGHQLAQHLNKENS